VGDHPAGRNRDPDPAFEVGYRGRSPDQVQLQDVCAAPHSAVDTARIAKPPLTVVAMKARFHLHLDFLIVSGCAGHTHGFIRSFAAKVFRGRLRGRQGQ